MRKSVLTDHLLAAYSPTTYISASSFPLARRNHRMEAVEDDMPTPTPVPLLDVNAGNRPLRDEILAAITSVCDSGRFLFGPDVKQLEASVAELCGVDHAIGCASGSDAILLALMAKGIQAGDEVITPSFTFFATASAVWRLGATPVFVDVDPVTFNLDMNQVEDAITPATRAVIPVHLFGQCADMQPLMELAGRRDLFIVEDAAQAIGAAYNSTPAGAVGDVGCFSFYPTKNLGGFGDGGMLTTHSSELAAKLRRLAAHGMEPRYYHKEVGINSRLDSIQAAALNVKLKHLPAWTESRRQHAARYTALLTAAGLASQLQLPREEQGNYHVWNQYTIRVPDGRRDELRQHMAASSVGAEIYYPVPLHQQECFKSLGYDAGSLPVTDTLAAEVLSLPVFPELTAAQQDRTVECVQDFFAGRIAKAA